MKYGNKEQLIFIFINLNWHLVQLRWAYWTFISLLYDQIRSILNLHLNFEFGLNLDFVYQPSLTGSKCRSTENYKTFLLSICIISLVSVAKTERLNWWLYYQEKQ